MVHTVVVWLSILVTYWYIINNYILYTRLTRRIYVLKLLLLQIYIYSTYTEHIQYASAHTPYFLSSQLWIRFII